MKLKDEREKGDLAHCLTCAALRVALFARIGICVCVSQRVLIVRIYIEMREKRRSALGWVINSVCNDV